MGTKEDVINKLKGIGASEEDLAIISNPEDEIPFLDESFEMDHDYVPSEELTIMQLNGEDVLTAGNIMTLVSPPGTGKSNLCEALCSSGINSECDAFGFTVNLRKDQSILLIDTERTKNDIWKGYRRIYNRSRTWEKPDQLEGSIYKKCRVHSYKVLDDITKCIEHLEYHISSGKYGLIILDQIGDFVKSVNKEDDCKLFVRQLEVWASKYDLGILCTIHPNPKDVSHKPTGHLGSALLKKSETVMVCYRLAENRDIRFVTTNFEHGKVRNAHDTLETAFEFNDELKMFITSNSETIKQAADLTSKRSKYIDSAFYTAFDSQIKYSPKDLCDRIKGILLEVGLKDKKKLENITPDYLAKYASERGIIEMTDGYYFLATDKTDSDDNIAPF